MIEKCCQYCGIEQASIFISFYGYESLLLTKTQCTDNTHYKSKTYFKTLNLDSFKP